MNLMVKYWLQADFFLIVGLQAPVGLLRKFQACAIL